MPSLLDVTLDFLDYTLRLESNFQDKVNAPLIPVQDASNQGRQRITLMATTIPSDKLIRTTP